MQYIVKSYTLYNLVFNSDVRTNIAHASLSHSTIRVLLVWIFNNILDKHCDNTPLGYSKTIVMPAHAIFAVIASDIKMPG